MFLASKNYHINGCFSFAPMQCSVVLFSHSLSDVDSRALMNMYLSLENKINKTEKIVIYSFLVQKLLHLLDTLGWQFPHNPMITVISDLFASLGIIDLFQKQFGVKVYSLFLPINE